MSVAERVRAFKRGTTNEVAERQQSETSRVPGAAGADNAGRLGHLETAPVSRFRHVGGRASRACGRAAERLLCLGLLPCGQKIKTAGKTRGYPIPA